MDYSPWQQSVPELDWKTAEQNQSYMPSNKTEEELLAQLQEMLLARSPAAEASQRPTTVDQIVADATTGQPQKLQSKLVDLVKTPQQLMTQLPSDLSKRQSAEVGSDYKATSDQTTQTALTLTPDQFAQSNFLAENSPAVREQRAGIKTLSDLALSQAENTPNHLDLSPLMALTDTWTGSKLTPNYQRPTAPEELAKQGLATQSEIQKRKEAITAKIEDLMKVQKAGFDTQKLTDMLIMQAKAKTGSDVPRGGGNQEANRLARLEKDIRTDIDKSVITPINTREEQFRNMDDYFKSGDYQAIAASMGSFLRGVAMEKGVLTDQDIQRNLPRNFHGSIAKFLAYFSETPSSKLDPAYTDSLRKIINTARGNAAKVYGDLLNDKMKNYKNSRSYDGISVDSFFNSARESVKRFGTVRGPGLNAAGGLTQEQEARRQELLKKAGK